MFNAIKLLIKAFCTLLPYRKELIIFEGNKSFDESSKAIYEYLLNHRISNEYKYIWFVDRPEKFSNTKNTIFLKYQPTPMYSIKGIIDFVIFIYYNLTAYYCFYCNVSLGYEFRHKQKRIYLNHGVGLKRLTGKMLSAKMVTNIVTTSGYVNNIFYKIMPDSENKTILLGAPRNDYLFKKNEKVYSYFASRSEKNKIIWMPTFRHLANSKRNDYGVSVQTDQHLLTDENIAILNKKLYEKNCLLVIKLHPFQDLNFVKNINVSNIVTITNDDIENMQCSTYSLLEYFDALITDYSSVAYDFLLTNRQIAFDLSDIKYYENGIGFLVDDIKKMMPGKHLYNVDDLCQFIEDVCKNRDVYQEDRNRIKKIFHKFDDDKSAYRVVNYFNL